MDRQRLRTFLLGGVVGALAGILLAPRSGRELRGSIRNRAGEAREQSRESLFQAQERMQERLAERAPSAREVPGRERSPEDEAFAGTAEVSGSPGPAPASSSRPPLRDVSWDATEEPAEGTAEDLRQRVQETRARLRARLDEPAKPDESREE